MKVTAPARARSAGTPTPAPTWAPRLPEEAGSGVLLVPGLLAEVECSDSLCMVVRLGIFEAKDTAVVDGCADVLDVWLWIGFRPFVDVTEDWEFDIVYPALRLRKFAVSEQQSPNEPASQHQLDAFVQYRTLIKLERLSTIMSTCSKGKSNISLEIVTRAKLWTLA